MTFEFFGIDLDSQGVMIHNGPVSSLFISHASEDKELVARPLAAELVAFGHEVWFDEYSLMVGDPLRASIDRGIEQSNFAIVILSHSFFEKKWTKDELEGFFSKESEDQDFRLVPIWHQVSRMDVVKFSPIVASRLALASDIGISELAAKISSDVNKFESLRKFTRAWVDSSGGGRLEISYHSNSHGTIRGFDEKYLKALQEEFVSKAEERLKNFKSLPPEP